MTAPRPSDRPATGPLVFPGHSAPGAGFEAPLAMLDACHRRVERQCATLQRLVPHLLAHGADGSAREAATAVLRYFDSAAVHHHADEEADLFPALLEAMAGSDAVCLRELTTGLAAEHRVLERQWQALRVELVAVAGGAEGRAGVDASTTLTADAVEAFVAGYARHIAREDGELLPMAQRLLDAHALATIGQAMQARRR